MKLSRFKTDAEKETGGVWYHVGAGLEILVARTRNTKFRERIRELMRPHLRSIRKGRVELDVVEDMNRQAVAETVLLDWRNLENDDGTKIPYSKEKALEVLKKHPEFEEIVTECAGDIENYREADRADAEENCQSTSGG